MSDENTSAMSGEVGFYPLSKHAPKLIFNPVYNQFNSVGSNLAKAYAKIIDHCLVRSEYQLDGGHF
jgi:hypothetical protein